MRSFCSLVAFFGLASIAAAAPTPEESFISKRVLQPLPLSTTDRWIIDASGAKVPFVGINWPGAADTMVPEGLQYQSIVSIVGKIAETGFNAVRLTFAIEMVDDILDNGGDVSLETTFANALGAANGATILAQVLANNPQFTAATTRLQVFDAIAIELAAQNIYLHLDNHVSKAMWCCALNDGNSWFGDTYFDTTKWVRGLTYMATHGATNWPTFSSVGLRNELRLPTTFAPGLLPYDWSTWTTQMTTAAASIHTANPNVLIFFGGWNSDFDISGAVSGNYFSLASLPYANKFVYEMHEYDEHLTGLGCTPYKIIMEGFGFDAITTTNGQRAPLVITEWGHDETDASGAYNQAYSTCLVSIMESAQLGFMLWVVAGSYYIRSGVQDTDESYGLLTHDWSAYRGDASLAALTSLISATYSAYGVTANT
jgi:hypothetical protein